MSKQAADEDDVPDEYASPVCYASQFPGYCGVEPLMNQPLIDRLNALLEAERAGAKVLTILRADVPPGSTASALLKLVQRDEADNAVALHKAIRRLGGVASQRIGDFVEKTLAIEGLLPRLRFVNKGQAWVARKIDEALPLAPDAVTRDLLVRMKQSHLDNISACAALVETGVG